MNPSWIVVAVQLAEQLIAFAKELKSNSGLTDDQLREQVKNENQATRDSIDKFLASL